jgi:hypothetical protein
MNHDTILSFIEDVKNSSFAHKFEDYNFAQNFYAALCNTVWDYKNQDFSVSWRTAGNVVAEIRNSLFNYKEDYMDYYCTGIPSTYDIEKNDDVYIIEGLVTPEISECFCELNMVMVSCQEFIDE